MTQLTDMLKTPDEANAAVGAFLRDMQPVSAQLARELAGAHDTLAHTRTHASPRHAHGARRREAGWQWGAVAACLIAGVALWAARGGVSPLSTESALAQQRSDSIFTWSPDQQLAAHDDHIFRARDVGDRIFGDSANASSSDRIFDGNLGGG